MIGEICSLGETEALQRGILAIFPVMAESPNAGKRGDLIDVRRRDVRTGSIGSGSGNSNVYGENHIRHETRAVYPQRRLPAQIQRSHHLQHPLSTQNDWPLSKAQESRLLRGDHRQHRRRRRQPDETPLQRLPLT